MSGLADISKILRNKKALILSFDQGLEHGPKIFDLKTIDPEYVMNIALEGDYTAIAMQPGLAEKYYHKAYRDIPLIVKLNGRTMMSHMNPLSKQTCSVDRAVKIGASAVGYTIYDGSPAEPEMFAEFGKICEEAHDYGIPVVAWMYPRGPGVRGHEEDSDTIAYVARVGLELGADFIKIKYNHDPAGYEWAVKSAGRAKVLMADREWTSNEDLLNSVYESIKAGGTGVAFGRTIWQHPRPFALTRALHAIIFHGKKPEEVMKFLKD